MCAERARAARSLSAVLAAATLAAVLAGCGSSSGGGTSASPASVTPASAQVFVGAMVRPEGSLKTAALAAGRELTHQSDPYLRLLAALETPGSRKLSFSRDVAPWLGRRAGIFVSSLGSVARVTGLLQRGLLGEDTSPSAFPFATAGVEGAIVMDTSDASSAGSFLDGQAARAGAHAASYRGVSMRTTSSGLSFAMVKRFAVIGSAGAVRKVIDTSLGGPSLKRVHDYARLAEVAPSKLLAHLYLGAAAAPATSGGEGGVLGALGLLSARNAASQVSLTASSSSLAVDDDMLGAPAASTAGGALSFGSGAAQALDELPGESWLAIGLGSAASRLSGDVSALLGLLAGGSHAGIEAAPATGTLSLGSLLGTLLEPLQDLSADTTQARREFASWMGAVGIFASGSSLLELKGGVTISSDDAARSRRAVTALADQLRAGGGSVSKASIAGTEAAMAVRLNGLPLVLDIAAGRDSAGRVEFVMGLGEASVRTALDPSSTLSGAASRTAAAAALGEGIQPALMVAVPTLLGLLESVGLTEERGLAKLLPYLRTVTSVTAGERSLGDGVTRVRVVAGLGG